MYQCKEIQFKRSIQLLEWAWKFDFAVPIIQRKQKIWSLRVLIAPIKKNILVTQESNYGCYKEAYVHAHFTSKERNCGKENLRNLLRAKWTDQTDPLRLSTSLYCFWCTKHIYFFLNSVTFSHGQNMLGQASVLLLVLRLMTQGHNSPVLGKDRKI